MPEVYVKATFSVPEGKVKEVAEKLERVNPELNSEEDIDRLYGVLGAEALELIKQTDKKGNRSWVDEQLTFVEQLVWDDFQVRDNIFKIQYMCGDEKVAEELAHFLSRLYKAANFSDVSVKTWSEWDEDEDDDEEGEDDW